MYYESRNFSRDTYPELYITKYTSMRTFTRDLQYKLHVHLRPFVLNDEPNLTRRELERSLNIEEGCCWVRVLLNREVGC